MRTAVPSGSRPRRAHIARRLGRDAVDRHVHRLLEADDDDAVGEPHLRLDLLGEREHEPGVAARGRDRDIPLTARRRRPGRKQQHQCGEQEDLQRDEHRHDAHAETRRHLRRLALPQRSQCDRQYAISRQPRGRHIGQRRGPA
jgi:hypothetical protein